MLKEAEKIYLSLKELKVRYFLVFLFFGLCSCQSVQDDPPNDTTVTPTPSKIVCPDTPLGSLANPEAININGQTVQKTGRIRSDNHIGFVFEGEQGQKLSYSYNNNDELCVWVYTPDNKRLFSGVKLPVNGTYVVQIAPLKETTTFKIEMKLSETISREKAINLIQKYLDAKTKMFGRAYNRKILAEIATDEFYKDAVGTIDWLKKYSKYYTYKVQKIESVEEFVSQDNAATIKVKIKEDYTLYNSDGSIDPSSSNFRTLTVIYNMKLTNGNLKIYARK